MLYKKFTIATDPIRNRHVDCRGIATARATRLHFGQKTRFWQAAFLTHRIYSLKYVCIVRAKVVCFMDYAATFYSLKFHLNHYIS